MKGFLELNPSKIPEIYAPRWGLEAHFREVKQSKEVFIFTSLLQAFFKALTYGALDEFEATLGPDLHDGIKSKINDTIVNLPEKSLQLDCVRFLAVKTL